MSKKVIGPFEELTYQIIGAALEIYNVLGPGFLEKVYQNALEKELEKRNLKFSSQKYHHIRYKGIIISKYKPDLIVENRVILELKALNELDQRLVEKQIISYLKVTNYKVALLFNFGSNRLVYRRIFPPRIF